MDFVQLTETQRQNFNENGYLTSSPGPGYN